MDYRLAVDRRHVVLALRAFGPRLRRLKGHERAILGFDGSYFTIEARDTFAIARAVGAWPGNANVSASLLVALCAAPPAEDSIVVTRDGEHLQFGPVKLSCHWQPVSRQLLKLPPAADWIRGLALSYTQPRGVLVQQGLVREVEASKRKLSTVVAKAAKSLAPLGITEGDVQAFVERRLEEQYVGRG